MTEAIEEEVTLEWSHLARVVYINDEGATMRALFPHGRARMGPDGAIWISTYTGDGHIAPVTGRYSPYYGSALLFYNDFYYPDEKGIKRKSILCRKIVVE